MGSFTRIYIAVMVIVAAIALVMAVKEVGIVVTMLTFGLALPLLFAATLLVYMVCFLPLVFAGPGGKAKVVGLAVSLVLVIAWALVPNWQAMREVRAAAAVLASGDRRPSTSAAARTFELRRTLSLASAMGSHILPDEPCSAFCRNLLLGDEVDWVRVVIVDGGPKKPGSAAATGSTVYVKATGVACQVPGEPPATGGSCVVFGQDRDEPAKLVAEITESYGIDRLAGRASSLFQPAGERVISIKTSGEEVLRHTQMTFNVVGKGSLLRVGFSGMSSGGTEFVKSAVSFNETSFEDLLRGVGYKLVASADAAPAERQERLWSDPPSSDRARAVVSLLNLPGQDAFKGEQAEVIDGWVAHARAYKEWPPERLELLRRIVRDRRVIFVSMFDQVFFRNPEVAAALMPDVLDRIDVMPDSGGLDPGYQGAIAMRRLDPALLKPYATRILGIIAKGGKRREIMLGVVGRIGVDPSPYLRPSNLDDGAAVSAKAFAACRAEDRWAPSLIPLLRAMVTDKELAKSSSAIEPVLVALMRHGDAAFVEQAIARSKWSDAGYLRHRLAGRLDRKGAGDRVC